MRIPVSKLIMMMGQCLRRSLSLSFRSIAHFRYRSNENDHHEFNLLIDWCSLLSCYSYYWIVLIDSYLSLSLIYHVYLCLYLLSSICLSLCCTFTLLSQPAGGQISPPACAPTRPAPNSDPTTLTLRGWSFSVCSVRSMMPHFLSGNDPARIGPDHSDTLRSLLSLITHHLSAASISLPFFRLSIFIPPPLFYTTLYTISSGLSLSSPVPLSWITLSTY